MNLPKKRLVLYGSAKSAAYIFFYPNDCLLPYISIASQVQNAYKKMEAIYAFIYSVSS